MAKKFKRHFTGHDHNSNGKGSWRRDTQVSRDEFDRNWDATFPRKKNGKSQQRRLRPGDGRATS